MLRSPHVLLLAALVAPLARPARADDAATAAMQAITGAATGGAPGGQAQGKKKDDGGFSRPLTAPQIIKTTGGSEKGETSRKSRSAKSKPSKYKSNALTESTEHTYRFDENAEPLGGAPKTKPVAKPKKKVSSDADEADAKAEKAANCTSEEACSAKNSPGDAF